MILDGGTATELDTIAPLPEGERDEPLWGTWALLHAPGDVLDVHRRYVAAGCDVVSTNTWGLTNADELERVGPPGEPLHWIDLARRGIRVGREAIAREGRSGEVALAFSLNGDVDSAEKLETLELLARVFEDEPPDLLLLETMTLIRDDLTFATVDGDARHRAPRLAVVPPLPAGGLRRLRPALGRPGGRRLRSCGAAAGGDGRGRAPDQLPAARPRARRAALAARLHRPPARRLSQPGLLHVGRLELRSRRRGGAVRPARALLACGGRGDRRRLLRGAPGADRRRPPEARRRAARASARRRRARARALCRSARGAAARSRIVDRRARSAAVPAAVPGDHRRARGVRAHPGLVPGLEASLRGRRRRRRPLRRHRLRHRRPGDPARAERRARRSMRSTSTGARSRTRSRTPFATASPTASRALWSTSTRGRPTRSTTSSSRACGRCPSTRSSARRATGRSTSGAGTSSTTSSRCCRGF